MWSIVAFTDEPITELGLQVLLRVDSEFKLICVCRAMEEFIHAAGQHQPDLLLFGLTNESNVGAALELRRVAPHAAVVVWSREVSADLAHRAIDMGVRGFVCTSAQADTFKECLRVAGGGELWMEKSLTMSLLNNRPIHLSRRQRQLVGLLVQGLKNKEIAATLGISEGTVKAYFTTLFEKVGAKDRFELALFGLKNLRHLHGSRGEDEPILPGHPESPVTRHPKRYPAAFPRRTRIDLRPKAGGWAS
jgi:two-component system, NarL family, nitrate/nitrite response regulator NarL